MPVPARSPRRLCLLVLLALVTPLTASPASHASAATVTVEAPAEDLPTTKGVTGYNNATVTVPMVFPVLAGARWSDTWLACRERDCSRKHLGQDLFAAKGTAILATFDGTVTNLGLDNGKSGTFLTLKADEGPWSVVYVHLDNDTPGTDDGRGGRAWAIAAGIERGVHVRAGQHLGWLGDSGNAERTPSHVHFALRSDTEYYNAAPSLRAAQVRSEGLDMQPRPAVTARPSGALDAAGLTADGQVRLRGWAADPGNPSTSVSVRMDGREVLVAPADGDRPDVAARGLPATSGFDVQVPLGSPGPHEVCVRALDTAGGPVAELGCQVFALPLPKMRAVRAA